MGVFRAVMSLLTIRQSLDQMENIEENQLFLYKGCCLVRKYNLSKYL